MSPLNKGVGMKPHQPMIHAVIVLDLKRYA